MPLTPEKVLTKRDESYGPALDADIFRMDDEQLRDYFGAVLLGRDFDAFASISFLPWTARLYAGGIEGDFGPTMAHLYKYAGEPERATEFYKEAGLPQPYGEYTDPQFRERLENVLLDHLNDFVTGRDVLARYGHTPETPWMAGNGLPLKDEYLEEIRRAILQGCVDVVSSILWNDGENSIEDQVSAILGGMGEGTLGEFAQRARNDIRVSVKANHQRLLSPIKQLIEMDRFVGGIELGTIEMYLGTTD